MEEFQHNLKINVDVLNLFNLKWIVGSVVCNTVKQMELGFREVVPCGCMSVAVDVKPDTLEKLIVKVVCGVVIVSYEVLRVILPCKKKEKKLKTGISEQPGEFLMLLLKLSKKD